MSQPSRARNRTRGTFAGTIAVNVASVTGRAGSAIALTRVPGEGRVQAALAVAGRYHCDALVIATPTGSTAYWAGNRVNAAAGRTP